MNTITINNKEYKVKYTIRAMFIFEQIKGESFAINTSLDNFIFLYSLILANNKDNPLSWDEFIDAIDNDPTIAQQINALATTNQDIFYQETSQESSEKKS